MKASVFGLTAVNLFFLSGVKKGKWIIGVNWNHENWGGEMPDAGWIDAPNHPVSF